MPIIDTEIIEGIDDGFEITPSTINYTLRMMNIDAIMEINPYLLGVRDVNNKPLTVELMATLCQREDEDSTIDEEDFYEAELQKLREAPAKKLQAQNEKVNKQFKEIQSKKIVENEKVETLQHSIDEIEEELRQSKTQLQDKEQNKPSPIKEKYDRNLDKYNDRVKELERQQETLERLSDFIKKFHEYDEAKRKEQEKVEDKKADLDEDLYITDVSRKSRVMKKYRPAADAREAINEDSAFLENIGVPEDDCKNFNVNNIEANIRCTPESLARTMNIVSFKFYAIEFNQTAFELRNSTVPSMLNLEFDFLDFPHCVTYPIYIGSNTQRIKYKDGAIYKLIK